MGRRVHAVARHLCARLCVVAACLRAVRTARPRVGDRVLPVVPRRPADASESERRRAGADATAAPKCRRAWTDTVGAADFVTCCVVARAAIRRVVVRMVLLYHVASDVPT